MVHSRLRLVLNIHRHQSQLVHSLATPSQMTYHHSRPLFLPPNLLPLHTLTTVSIHDEDRSLSLLPPPPTMPLDFQVPIKHHTSHIPRALSTGWLNTPVFTMAKSTSLTSRLSLKAGMRTTTVLLDHLFPRNTLVQRSSTQHILPAPFHLTLRTLTPSIHLPRHHIHFRGLVRTLMAYL